MQWLAVAIGGAIGALSRYGLSCLLPPVNGFPWATLFANIIGSILIGVCYVVIVEKGLIAEEWRPLLMVGFLGALTTFSTFALDAILMWQAGQSYLSIVYVVVSVLGCIAGAVASIYWVERLI
jgi:CrcB protein